MGVSGNPEDVKKFVEDMIGEDDNHFDFNKVDPMPEIMGKINLIFGTTESSGWFYNEDAKPLLQRVRVPQEIIDELEREHGTAYWYDWAREHWGTKWGLYEVDEPKWMTPRYVRYHFVTAWSPPRPILEKLRVKYPMLKFSWRYCVEGWCGGWMHKEA